MKNGLFKFFVEKTGIFSKNFYRYRELYCNSILKKMDFLVKIAFLGKDRHFLWFLVKKCHFLVKNWKKWTLLQKFSKSKKHKGDP
jgi:hypothetical protein